MKLSMTLLAICSATLVLSACDHDDRRTDAGQARSQAEEGRDAVAQAAHPESASRAGAEQYGQPEASVRGASAADGGRVSLAMSGTPSSHLVDGAGHAVYVLAGNTDGSKCDAACQEAWPPVFAHGVDASAGMGVDPAMMGTLERDGRIHVTYGGEPLYRYAGDAGANRTAGAGVEDQWGKWSLVGLDGRPLPDPQ